MGKAHTEREGHPGTSEPTLPQKQSRGKPTWTRLGKRRSLTSRTDHSASACFDERTNIDRRRQRRTSTQTYVRQEVTGRRTLMHQPTSLRGKRLGGAPTSLDCSDPGRINLFHRLGVGSNKPGSWERLPAGNLPWIRKRFQGRVTPGP